MMLVQYYHNLCGCAHIADCLSSQPRNGESNSVTTYVSEIHTGKTSEAKQQRRKKEKKKRKREMWVEEI